MRKRSSKITKIVRETLAGARFDTAAMPYLYAPEALPMALKILPPENFFFGTDCPLLRPARYRRYFELAGLSQAETEAIMGGAAAAWLGL